MQRELETLDGVALIPLGARIAQKPGPPSRQVRQRLQVQLQRRIRPPDGLQQHPPAPRRIPRLRHAGCQQRAVGEARLQPRPLLTVENGDFPAPTREKISGSDADQATADDERFHWIPDACCKRAATAYASRRSPRRAPAPPWPRSARDALPSAQ